MGSSRLLISSGLDPALEYAQSNEAFALAVRCGSEIVFLLRHPTTATHGEALLCQSEQQTGCATTESLRVLSDRKMLVDDFDRLVFLKEVKESVARLSVFVPL